MEGSDKLQADSLYSKSKGKISSSKMGTGFLTGRLRRGRHSMNAPVVYLRLCDEDESAVCKRRLVVYQVRLYSSHSHLTWQYNRTVLFFIVKDEAPMEVSSPSLQKVGLNCKKESEGLRNVEKEVEEDPVAEGSSDTQDKSEAGETGNGHEKEKKEELTPEVAQPSCEDSVVQVPAHADVSFYKKLEAFLKPTLSNLSSFLSVQSSRVKRYSLLSSHTVLMM